jgi:Transglutaminase-like superfamily
MVCQTAESLRRVARLSLQDWRYLAIAVKEMLIARIRHATLPIGGILQELQCPVKVDELPLRKAEVDVARLSWAIGAAAARVPWRADCLVQVMAAHRWLRRHRLRSDFFLGVARNFTGALEAHVWLRFDNLEVTGGSGEAFFALIEPRPHIGDPTTSL